MKNRADAVEFLDYINADAAEFLDYINADAIEFLDYINADAVEFLDYINADAVEFLDYINADAVGKGIQPDNETTKQPDNKTTNLHTPREICGVAGYDVLICFDELTCHAVIDTDGRTASGRTIGQHDGAIVLITQS